MSVNEDIAHRASYKPHCAFCDSDEHYTVDHPRSRPRMSSAVEICRNCSQPKSHANHDMAHGCIYTPAAVVEPPREATDCLARCRVDSVEHACYLPKGHRSAHVAGPVGAGIVWDDDGSSLNERANGLKVEPIPRAVVEPPREGPTISDDKYLDTFVGNLHYYAASAIEGERMQYRVTSRIRATQAAQIITSLRSALSAAQHDSEEVAWVVVGGRPGLEYLTGEITPRWSGNHADAIRFARKQDAERMIELMREILRSHGIVLPHDIRAEEHIWDAARAAVSPSPEPDK